MKKIVFVAYKPNSSQANCRCGCSGCTEYESDFTLAMVDTIEELGELFYTHELRDRHLGQGETRFTIHVLQDGEDVFTAGDWSSPSCEDSHQIILETYEISQKRAIQVVNEEKDKKLQAEKEKLKKEQDARDALRRQQYEKLKEEFGEK